MSTPHFNKVDDVNLDLFQDVEIRAQLRQLLQKLKFLRKELDKAKQKNNDETLINTCTANITKAEQEILTFVNKHYTPENNIVVEVPAEKPKEEWIKFIDHIGTTEHQYINCRLLELIEQKSESSVLEKIDVILEEHSTDLTVETISYGMKVCVESGQSTIAAKLVPLLDAKVSTLETEQAVEDEDEKLLIKEKEELDKEKEELDKQLEELERKKAELAEREKKYQEKLEELTKKKQELLETRKVIAEKGRTLCNLLTEFCEDMKKLK